MTNTADEQYQRNKGHERPNGSLLLHIYRIRYSEQFVYVTVNYHLIVEQIGNQSEFKIYGQIRFIEPIS